MFLLEILLGGFNGFIAVKMLLKFISDYVCFLDSFDEAFLGFSLRQKQEVWLLAELAGL